MNLEQKVIKYIDDNQMLMYNALSEMVRIDTQNYVSEGNENAGQEYLGELLKKEGFEVDIFAPDSVEGLTESDEYNPGRGTDKRNNLVAVLRGESDAGGIMLCSHMDTMPVGDLSLWDESPFSGTVKDGKIYGRGSGDDKFGLALGWFVMKTFKDCGIKPGKNILLGSYVDEEKGGGNGALGLCMKYPCDCYINLDSKGFEMVALGGACYRFNVRSTQNDKSIASVADVFDGLASVVSELEKLGSMDNKTFRLSQFKGGEGGEKEGYISFAIYTDESCEQTKARLDEILEKCKPTLSKLKLASEGFVRTTKFFRYGETTADSIEAEMLMDAVEEITGIHPSADGSCLSDLSVFMNFGSKNSFNYGIPRGSEDGGGAHQPNEHIYCSELLNCTKAIALMLLRRIGE